jgi:hypothetical protein
LGFRIPGEALMDQSRSETVNDARRRVGFVYGVKLETDCVRRLAWRVHRGLKIAVNICHGTPSAPSIRWQWVSNRSRRTYDPSWQNATMTTPILCVEHVFHVVMCMARQYVNVLPRLGQL